MEGSQNLTQSTNVSNQGYPRVPCLCPSVISRGSKLQSPVDFMSVLSFLNVRGLIVARHKGWTLDYDDSEQSQAAHIPGPLWQIKSKMIRLQVSNHCFNNDCMFCMCRVTPPLRCLAMTPISTFLPRPAQRPLSHTGHRSFIRPRARNGAEEQTL